MVLSRPIAQNKPNKRFGLSIVIPVYNEAGNLFLLYEELKKTLSDIGLTNEVIFINDGSKDDSLNILGKIAAKDHSVKVIDFAYNFGQTAAMSAGIKASSGDIIIPMDSDLQNDPADIPKFLKKISEGYDAVSGWRKDRQDALFSRKIPSKIANWIIGLMTGVHVHDYGCSMKAYKKEMIQGVNLYGEMHRFIPAYVNWNGGKVTEIVVNHRARKFGSTKYGISRTFKVILDLVVVKFLSRYLNRPIHFFGGLGFISLFLGFIVAATAIIFKVIGYKTLTATPLPLFSAMLVIVGIQLIVMGVIAELLMRVYYESQEKTPYAVRRIINF
ncbi:MAG: glycosyltransferase family 2 protein [Patescibacteria group bacterium]